MWLEANVKGEFSENGFFMITPTKNIVFHTEQPVDGNKLMETLTVTHLLDSQYK